MREWIKQADVDAGKAQSGALTTAEREELARLRREVRALQMEREILRKATAFFAKETEERRFEGAPSAGFLLTLPMALARWVASGTTAIRSMSSAGAEETAIAPLRQRFRGPR